MRNWLNPDAPIIQALSKFSWMMWYSCLWLLCCLPIVTIGAANAAMYRMAFNMRQDGNYNTKAFFDAFKENLKKGTVLGLVHLLLAVVLVAAYYGIVCVENEMLRTVLLAPFSLCFLLWGFLLIYLYPLTAFFENSVKNTLLNAVAMSTRHLRQSVYCFALVMIPVIALVLSQLWFLKLLYIWLFIYPCVAAYWITGILKPVFLNYVPEEERDTL